MNDIKLKYSVIIPLYNKGAYISKAINSVLLQDSTSVYELIVVDDGSTDDSAEVVNAMMNNNDKLQLLQANGRFKFISQGNSGVSAARNRGIIDSKGDYVCFLDADDWWESGFLSAIDFLADKYPNIAVLAVQLFYVKNGSRKIIDAGLNPNILYGLVDYEKVTQRERCRPISSSSVAISRKYLDFSQLFNTKYKLGEDFDFFFRMYLIGGLAVYNRPLSNYNQDVDLSNKATVSFKLYPKETSAFFHLEYKEAESRPAVAHFLEHLKLRAFYLYYINGLYSEEIKEQLSDIKWKNHPFSQFLRYKIIPKSLQRFWLSCMVTGSKIKNNLIKFVKI